MKIPNKRELQQIASNHSSDIDFKDFIKLYKDYTKQPHSFSVNDTTFSSDNPLRFWKSLLQKGILVRKSKKSMTKLSKTKFSMV